VGLFSWVGVFDSYLPAKIRYPVGYSKNFPSNRRPVTFPQAKRSAAMKTGRGKTAAGTVGKRAGGRPAVKI